MMTPAQLKAYEFKSAGRNAYRADDVDSFFGEVSVDYEKMFRENSELIKRISLLADKLEQYKNDEGDIKQAVLSAQKAANLIVKEAQESVAGAQKEAEDIVLNAKQEAQSVIAEAEKQAIADADLALSVAADKAEDIIAKAKEKARSIIIDAESSAKDTMGAANRTVTSESLHFDMLKKEVSEFRASVLAQYKAHIELLSKLPELAVEEAAKLENNEEVEETEAFDEAVEQNDAECEACDEQTADESVLEYVAEDDSGDEEELPEGEEVVKTQLPYEFFSGDSSLEFVNDDVAEDNVVGIEDFSLDIADDSTTADIPITKRFSVDLSEFDSSVISFEEELPVEAFESSADIDEDSAFDDSDETAVAVDSAEDTEEPAEEGSAAIDENFGYEDDEDDDYDIILSSGFFDSVEKIEADDSSDDDSSSSKFGFFRKKKK